MTETATVRDDHLDLADSMEKRCSVSNQNDSVTPDEAKSFENPNYRKLYAKLSMDAMIGKISPENDETENNDNSLEEYDESKPMLNNDESPEKIRETVESELDFYYDDEYYEEEDEEDEDDDEYETDYLNEQTNLETNESSTKDKTNSDSNLPSNKIPMDYELPEGWERHQDELGPYFWHIPTGTIQRERPYLDTIDKSMIRSDSLVFLDKSAINVDYNPSDLIEEETNKEAKVNKNEKDESIIERKALISKKKLVSNLRLTFPTDDEDNGDEDDDDSFEVHEDLSYVVHSLGWLDVDESQINSQTGSLVVKRCIYELSNRADNATRCWGLGDTQSLILRLGAEKICLLDPSTETILSIQLIREIRMWAVDDQNNFAYVVKDRSVTGNGTANSKSVLTLKCHVFHCDEEENVHSAQRIAMHLRDSLVRIKNKQMKQGKHMRPTDLLFKRENPQGSESSYNSFEFPTPIEEPRKTLSVLYMGFVPVVKPMGVDVLNMAIEEVVSSLKMSLSNENGSEEELMRPVWIHISPSNIVVECRESGATLIECRVRYLSFLGISLDNVKRCGFIMQVNEKEFVAHCFQTEPSAGALCKTIEAACKLRYQKCLDAHARMQKMNEANAKRNGKLTYNDCSQLQQKSSPVAAIKSSIVGVFSKILSK